MRSVFRVLGSRPLVGHWRIKLTAAAVLLAALAIGFSVLRHGTEQAAYALEDLPDRLLEVKSVYMTGWRFEPNWASKQDETAPARYAIKIFAERPDCYWHSFCSFSGPDMTHKDVRVHSGYAAGKGTRLVVVSDNEKTAMETTVAPIASELSTEMLIQEQLPQQWGGRPSDFAKTGTEWVDNVLCDVYERSLDLPKAPKDMPLRRSRLWLNPKTGLPVRIASYDVDRTGKETLSMLFDHVEVNIPASATGLSFDPPEGYKVVKTPESEVASPFQPVGSGSNGEVSLGVWHCFNIDDRAVLLCWYCDSKSDSKTGDAPTMPEFFLGDTRPCEYGDIASAEVGGHRWRWSLVWPKRTGERVGNDCFSAVHHPKGGGSLSTGNFPLRLREDRLKAILEEVQRITKTTVPGSSEPFTLEMLRAKVDQQR